MTGFSFWNYSCILHQWQAIDININSEKDELLADSGSWNTPHSGSQHVDDTPYYALHRARTDEEKFLPFRRRTQRIQHTLGTPRIRECRSRLNSVTLWPFNACSARGTRLNSATFRRVTYPTKEFQVEHFKLSSCSILSTGSNILICKVTLRRVHPPLQR